MDTKDKGGEGTVRERRWEGVRGRERKREMQTYYIHSNLPMTPCSVVSRNFLRSATVENSFALGPACLLM